MSQCNDINAKVVGLYAVLAYSLGDFIDMIQDEPEQVLQPLYDTLALPNEKHSKDTKELNSLGAILVKNRLDLLKGMDDPKESEGIP